MVTAIAMGAAVHFVYGEKGRVAAASAVVTGASLYVAYYCKLRSNPKINGFMSLEDQENYLWTPLTEDQLNEIRKITNQN